MNNEAVDLAELDQILQRVTSELPNHLQGVSFIVFNKDGQCITLFSLPSRASPDVVQAKRYTAKHMGTGLWKLIASHY